MTVESVEIRIRGRNTPVPSVEIEGRRIITKGRWIQIAVARDEELIEGKIIPEPATFIPRLKMSGIGADILTFPQKIDEPTPKYQFPMEWDNAAVARTGSFQQWWENLPQESRKNARRAGKRGVTVEVATFTDEFVKGIKAIYDESPVRQGMRFWHYGKDFEVVKVENETYLERSEFIGAYFNGELIGFMKFVYVDKVARIMQILSKSAHFDKRPMNALIAKAVEVCQQKGMDYLVYSKFSFGNKAKSQLAEFKRRNGFEEMRFPRYYVPLTWKGRLAVTLKVHRGLLGVLPSPAINILLRGRALILGLKQKFRGRAQPQTRAGESMPGSGTIEQPPRSLV